MKREVEKFKKKKKNPPNQVVLKKEACWVTKVDRTGTESPWPFLALPSLPPVHLAITRPGTVWSRDGARGGCTGLRTHSAWPTSQILHGGGEVQRPAAGCLPLRPGPHRRLSRRVRGQEDHTIRGRRTRRLRMRAGGRTKGSEGGVVDDPRPERKKLRELNGCIS